MARQRGAAKKVKHNNNEFEQMDMLFGLNHSLSIGKWNQFIAGSFSPLHSEGVDLLEDNGAESFYFSDDLGSMRYRGPDRVVYYVFIDDDNIPYHVHPDYIYRYKPGERLIANQLKGEHLSYLIDK